MFVCLCAFALFAVSNHYKDAEKKERKKERQKCSVSNAYGSISAVATLPFDVVCDVYGLLFFRVFQLKLIEILLPFFLSILSFFHLYAAMIW